MTSLPSRESQRKTIEELGENDVLLGRGSGPNEFIGNKRFRALVKQTARQALDESTSSDGSGTLKQIYTNKIFHDVKLKGGRFVTKDSFVGKKRHGQGFVENRFVVVPDDVAKAKVKQSLRYQLDILRRKDQQSSLRNNRCIPSEVPSVEVEEKCEKSKSSGSRIFNFHGINDNDSTLHDSMLHDSRSLVSLSSGVNSMSVSPTNEVNRCQAEQFITDRTAASRLDSPNLLVERAARALLSCEKGRNLVDERLKSVLGVQNLLSRRESNDSATKTYYLQDPTLSAQSEGHKID